ncbi:MAG: tetratricopeptide repeat protein [Cystobacter sp.]
MVLPPSAPDDASRPAEAHWLDSLKFALRLSRSGLLLLVDHARQESLGELVEALLPEHPELEVHTDVRQMLEAAHGSTQVLVPRVEDADWLNINRPLFAQRELRVVLFCDTETTIALAQRAVDFFDWISHRVECPVRPPRFAVAGLRTALAVRVPGLIWTGGDLRAAFAAARPRGTLHWVSAVIPYSKMVEEIRKHPHAWIAWTDVNSHFRLRRVRWAHAETGHHTRAILIEPTVPSPGWWTLHGQMADIREARARLEAAGVRFPGRVAALHDFEPTAIAEIESRENHAHADLQVEHEGTRLLRDGVLLSRTHHSSYTQLRERCRQALLAQNERLAESTRFSLDEGLTATAWSISIPSSQANRTIALSEFAQLNPAHSLELVLPRRMHMAEKWAALTLQAILLHDLEAAEHWSSRIKEEEGSGAQLMLALMRSMRGESQEAERLLRARLSTDADPSSLESIERDTLISSLAAVLENQGKHDEAEMLLRKELARLDHIQEFNTPSKNDLLYQLASVLRMQNKHPEAQKIISQAISLHPNQSDSDRANLGRRYTELARISADLGHLDEAEQTFQKALNLIGGALGAGHTSFTTALTELFNLLSNQGRQGETEPLLRDAIHEIQAQRDEENPNHAKLLALLASILDDQGEYTKAEELLTQAIAINNISATDDLATKWTIAQLLAHVIQRQGRYDEAELYFRQAVSIAEEAPDVYRIPLKESLLSLAACISRQGRAAETEPLFSRVLKLLRAEQEHVNVDTINGFYDLSFIQNQSGNHKAGATAQEALYLVETTPGLAQSIPRELIDNLTALAQTDRKPPGD